jgi:tetratricopeptide (TPR) repeat protein
MDRATKTLDEYFKDIHANYRAIDGLILKPGKADTEEIVARLSEQRRAAKSSAEKAIYSYLLARAHYWRGFHEFKATRDPEIFATLRPKVFAEFLAAFTDVTSAEETQAVTDEVRQDVVRAFASALATNLWGANLSPEEKQQAVTEFVDVVERMPGHEDIFPSGESLARMYRNLGIETRLVRVIPEELPTECDRLFALIDKARGVVPPERLLPIAEAIERDHMSRVEKVPDRLQALAEIYRLNGLFDRAFRLLSVAASKNSQYCFDLYALSLNGKLNIPPAERNAYLDRFIAGGSSARRGSPGASGATYSRSEGYGRVVRYLSSAGRYKECLDLIARYEGDNSFERGVREPVDILLAKARCLDKTGDIQAALAAYRAFLEKATGWGGSYVRSRELAKQRILQLAAK